MFNSNINAVPVGSCLKVVKTLMAFFFFPFHSTNAQELVSPSSIYELKFWPKSDYISPLMAFISMIHCSLHTNTSLSLVPKYVFFVLSTTNSFSQSNDMHIQPLPGSSARGPGTNFTRCGAHTFESF